MKKLWIALSLCLLLTGCGAKHTPNPHTNAVDLMQDIPRSAIQYEGLPEEASSAITNFSQSLLLNSLAEQDNVLLSPLSVLNALAMTANGARNETLRQMETAFGAPLDTMNQALSQYLALEQEVFTISNSIWLRDDTVSTVKDSFLQTNGSYYNASVFRTPMDKSTLRDINSWISQSTEGRIPELVKEVSKETLLYLINALTFNGTWSDPYTVNQVRSAEFTRDDGSAQTVNLMYDTCNIYLEDAYAAGFMKPYQDGRYAFAALRPKDGVTVDQYLDTLHDGALYDLLLDAERANVQTAIPKFEIKYDSALKSALQAMGVTDAFDPQAADLSEIASSPLYISTILHGTYMKVNETGTEAAAATAIPAPEAAPAQAKPKVVYLDKPFVYLIWDQIDQIPLFIGVMREIP